MKLLVELVLSGYKTRTNAVEIEANRRTILLCLTLTRLLEERGAFRLTKQAWRPVAQLVSKEMRSSIEQDLAATNLSSAKESCREVLTTELKCLPLDIQQLVLLLVINLLWWRYPMPRKTEWVTAPVLTRNAEVSRSSQLQVVLQVVTIPWIVVQPTLREKTLRAHLSMYQASAMRLQAVATIQLRAPLLLNKWNRNSAQDINRQWAAQVHQLLLCITRQCSEPNVQASNMARKSAHDSVATLETSQQASVAKAQLAAVSRFNLWNKQLFLPNHLWQVLAGWKWKHPLRRWLPLSSKLRRPPTKNLIQRGSTNLIFLTTTNENIKVTINERKTDHLQVNKKLYSKWS